MASSPGFGMPGMPGMEAWNSFWSDFLSKSMPPGVSPTTPPAEFAERMRKGFFEAMSKYFEEYLRSESFLNSMKQSMDHALAWQQAMNQYMQNSLSSAQAPTRADADHVVLLIRGMEDRVMARLDDLTERVERLETPKKG
jgi:hypothetical protein